MNNKKIDTLLRQSLQKAIPPGSITRFAPSPTGHLHLGHIFSLAYLFAVAQITQAKVLLRIEDHDRQRCRKEYEEAIVKDIEWLGLIPDNWNLINNPFCPSEYRQSDCTEYYLSALKTLESKNLLYHCSCSRKQISQAATKPTSYEQHYPNTCRYRNLPESSETGIRMILPEVKESFTDLLQGQQQQIPQQQCGDILLRDRLGNFTYNFAVVVDDLRQGVNVIIRGMDLIHCTGRQRILANYLFDSKDPILTLHHPLITDREGKKLSKRELSEGVIVRRLKGDNPQDILGEALHCQGIIKTHKRVFPEDLGKLFFPND